LRWFGDWKLPLTKLGLNGDREPKAEVVLLNRLRVQQCYRPQLSVAPQKEKSTFILGAAEFATSITVLQTKSTFAAKPHLICLTNNNCANKNWYHTKLWVISGF
jgi:hypothetical protein